MSDLAGRLRELRGQLSQKELAAELGVSAALVSSWENRNAPPPLLRLQQYASRFSDSEQSREQLIAELLELRREECSDTAGTELADDDTLFDVLKDIRWLLVEIRDRLP